MVGTGAGLESSGMLFLGLDGDWRACCLTATAISMA